MVDLTVHGGVGEIGGNKVLVGSTHGSVLLDFGMSFNAMADYYSEFCQPRSHSYLGDQVELGLLPEMPGLYREDHVRKAGDETGLPKAAPDKLAGVTVIKMEFASKPRQKLRAGCVLV